VTNLILLFDLSIKVRTAYFLRVRAAFFAERDREAAERLAAALRA
jgi:hypothetical protein